MVTIASTKYFKNDQRVLFDLVVVHEERLQIMPVFLHLPLFRFCLHVAFLHPPGCRHPHLAKCTKLWSGSVKAGDIIAGSMHTEYS